MFINSSRTRPGSRTRSSSPSIRVLSVLEDAPKGAESQPHVSRVRQYEDTPLNFPVPLVAAAFLARLSRSDTPGPSSLISPALFPRPSLTSLFSSAGVLGLLPRSGHASRPPSPFSRAAAQALLAKREDVIGGGGRILSLPLDAFFLKDRLESPFFSR